ncbi:hypothetical protein [Actinoplanes sp. ATCC 53533]|uniref:hypothetical protein n=1 Tax=Actinoplanes sp. ATCC 53533 TaxID=1288362 RepID=UPI00131547E2|nr:hypothetical protein [Actinoplanes sp. ATCC 53533]
MSEPVLTSSWCTAWGSYNTPRLWAMVKDEDDPEAWRQVAAWGAISGAVKDQRSLLLKAREALVAAWPPEQNKSSEAFVREVDELIGRMDAARSEADDTSTGLANILEALRQAKNNIRPLWEQYKDKSDDLIPAWWDNAEDELDQQARAHMLTAEQIVQDNVARLRIPDPYALQPADPHFQPAPLADGGGPGSGLPDAAGGGDSAGGRAGSGVTVPVPHDPVPPLPGREPTVPSGADAGGGGSTGGGSTSGGGGAGVGGGPGLAGIINPPVVTPPPVTSPPGGGAFPPGAFPPGAFPPGAFPPGAFPPDGGVPGIVPSIVGPGPGPGLGAGGSGAGGSGAGGTGPGGMGGSRRGGSGGSGGTGADGAEPRPRGAGTGGGTGAGGGGGGGTGGLGAGGFGGVGRGARSGASREATGRARGGTFRDGVVGGSAVQGAAGRGAELVRPPRPSWLPDEPVGAARTAGTLGMPGGARGGRRLGAGEQRPLGPGNPWEVATGVDPVIEPGQGAARHDPGPNVIGWHE